MREIVQEWVDKGNSDFIAAKILALKEGLENQTGFHCQQAIEKWLKAYLSDSCKNFLFMTRAGHRGRGFAALLCKNNSDLQAPPDLCEGGHVTVK